MPKCIWTTIQPCLQKLKMAEGSTGTAKNRLRQVFTTSNSVQNIIPYIMQIILHLLPSVIWWVISYLSSAPPLVTRNVVQNTRPSRSEFTCAEGLGLLQKRDPCSLVIGKPHPCWIGLFPCFFDREIPPQFSNISRTDIMLCYLEPRSNWCKVCNCRYILLSFESFFLCDYFLSSHIGCWSQSRKQRRENWGGLWPSSLTLIMRCLWSVSMGLASTLPSQLKRTPSEDWTEPILNVGRWAYLTGLQTYTTLWLLSHFHNGPRLRWPS